jgi:hypothetical protein
MYARRILVEKVPPFSAALSSCSDPFAA